MVIFFGRGMVLLTKVNYTYSIIFKLMQDTNDMGLLTLLGGKNTNFKNKQLIINILKRD